MRSQRDVVGYVFRCPACEESLAVNTAMRDALVERGCVVCGASLTADAFTRTPSTDCPR